MARPEPALARHVPDLWPDLEHLFETGEAVELLEGHPGWIAVQHLLRAEIDAINAQMEGSTQVLPQADYAVRHGRIGGLRAARGAVETILAVSDARRKEQAARHEAVAESTAER